MSCSNCHGDNKKLLRLCEKQLVGIVEDTESFFNTVTATALELANNIEKLKETINDSGIVDSKIDDVFLDIENQSNDFIVNLQFFDEFSQRINHVKEAMNYFDQTDNSEDLTSLVLALFATRAESAVVKSVFGVSLAESATDTETMNADLF